tara:strand:- start:58 stop:1008 length:951 start_codon:yes stop_codon:yes gene_type:complete
MIISETKLKLIIREEITHRILDQFIDEELKKMNLNEDEVDDEYERSKARARKKKIRDLAMAFGGAATAASPVVGAYMDYSKAKSDERSAAETAAELKAQSTAVKRQELVDYINNTAAFRWGKGGETMMQAPGKRGYGGTSVLPPSYSVIQQVYFDKMAGKPRYGIPKSAEDLRKMGQTDPSAQGNPDDNLKSFFQDFDEKYMIDAVNFMSSQAHVKQVPGTGIESEIIMLDPSQIPANYILPENGMTVKDYYNWAYFNQFLSSDEIKSLGIGNPESSTQTKTVDITPEQPPGEDLKSIPVQTDTWKENKYRKKKLA